MEGGGLETVISVALIDFVLPPPVPLSSLPLLSHLSERFVRANFEIH